MKGLKACIFQDLLYVISKRNLQNKSITRLHNFAPFARFSSFFKVSRNDEQSLYKTKGNESSDDHVILEAKELKVEEARLEAVKDEYNIAAIQEAKIPILEMTEATSGLPGLYNEKSTKSLINKVNEVQTNSMGVVNFASASAKDKGKTSVFIMKSVPYLRITKSFPDQIVSRYFSALAEPLIGNPEIFEPEAVQAVSNEATCKSTENQGKNRNKKEKKNNCKKNPPPSSPCCPPPPPPPCWIPPPLPAPQSYFAEEISLKSEKISASSTCIESDPGTQPRAFCVKVKTKNGKGFSSWAHSTSAMLVAYRFFANGACNSKSGKGDNSDKFNKRMPKPGPGCKKSGGGDCKPAKKAKYDKCKSKVDKCKPKEDKCEKPKKACKPAPTSVLDSNKVLSSSETPEKNQELSVESIIKKEYEEVRKCKEGRKGECRPQIKKAKNECQKQDKKPEAKKAAEKSKIPAGLERVISPCKLERMQKSASKSQEVNAKMIVIDDRIGSLFKNLLRDLQIFKSDLFQQESNNYHPITQLKIDTWAHLSKFDFSLFNKFNLKKDKHRKGNLIV